MKRKSQHPSETNEQPQGNWPILHTPALQRQARKTMPALHHTLDAEEASNLRKLQPTKHFPTQIQDVVPHVLREM